MIETISKSAIESFKQVFSLAAATFSDIFEKKEYKYKAAIFADLLFLSAVFYFGFSHKTFQSALSPFPQTVAKKQQGEVFGFAPFWTFNNLDKVDFSTLTTFAYFGITVNADGTFETDDPGYQTFMSNHATQIFQRAHENGTRVVLTLTQMNSYPLLTFLDDPQAQNTLIRNAITMVKNKGIDGVNVDFEYIADPGNSYRNEFSRFISNLTSKMHQAIPGSYVTVSVIASSVKEPTMYDIHSIGNTADSIFMMAYDFGYAGSENAMPTSPLYGYKSGEYWYDVSTAVSDFLTQMPAQKLILGLPWYGYDYSVYQPGVKAQTTWAGGTAEMYGDAQSNITASNPNIEDLTTGWDNQGEVGYKAYYDDYSGTWRIMFLDDPKSLAIKYDFAKSKNLAGVGIWALGFEDGNQAMWNLLRKKFGTKIADNHSLIQKAYASTD